MFRLCWEQAAYVRVEFTTSLELGELFYRILKNVPESIISSGTFRLNVWSVRETRWVMYGDFGFVMDHHPYISIQRLFTVRRLIADYAYAHGSY